MRKMNWIYRRLGGIFDLESLNVKIDELEKETFREDFEEGIQIQGFLLERECATRWVMI